MVRIIQRMAKALLNPKRILVLFGIVCGICIIFVMVTDSYCPTTYNDKKPKSDQLSELKKVWITEYEEQRLQNEKIKNDGSEGLQENFAKYETIECSINNDYNVNCLRLSGSDEDIYMPFTFIEKYFEVYGKLKRYDAIDRFEFLQSYAQVVYDTTKQYKFDGVFMTFDTYNVEIRDRVKCITGIEGVPISTQWGSQGYFYPIQISQYALSHFSKNVNEKPPHRTVYEDAENSAQAGWKSSNRNCFVENVLDPRDVNKRVIKFSTPESIKLGEGISLTLGNTMEYGLSFDFQFITNGSITVVLEASEHRKEKLYYIHYLTYGKMIDSDKTSNVMYNIGKRTEWSHIARDLLTDLSKGLGLTNAKSVTKVKVNLRKVVKIILRGEGFIDNIVISTNDHMANFLNGVEWLYKNQSPDTGAWPILIERRLGGVDVLEPGWVSAMAQGQALSTLARAYEYTQDEKYLKNIYNALNPYTKLSADGGVKAIFMEKYTWYEEYPTHPSSFVLNGFIYSLFGLYDTKSVLEKRKLSAVDWTKEDEHALILSTNLLNDGMISLKEMLPLYDSGSRTFYDLRHLSLKVQPNIARWDYHTTHMSQLAMLATIDNDPIFPRYFEYWKGYMHGKVAKHN